MKHLRVPAILILALSISTGSTFAQKKPAKRPAAKKPVPAKTTTVLPPLEVRAAREKLVTQNANLNLFIDKLGPIAQDIEDFYRSVPARRPNAKALAQYDSNKQRVIEAIQGWRSVLISLETEFRTVAPLKKYLANIDGISDLAAEAEDSAIAGRFVIAKEPLRTAAQRLADTLAVMPKSPAI